MENELKELGFTQHEADVYLALVDAGQTGAGEIIKKTGLHRNIVYENLDKLINKKLVFKILKNKVTQFQVSDPEIILSLQKTKLDLAEKLIPDLKTRAKIKYDVVVWDGIEGFKNFSINQIGQMKPGSTLYVLGSVGDRWYEQMGNKLNQYIRIKTKNKILWKMVTFEKSNFDKKTMKEEGLVEVKVLPQSMQSPASTLIWDDHIALQTFIEPYSVIEIKNAALTDAYLNYFNALWLTGSDL